MTPWKSATRSYLTDLANTVNIALQTKVRVDAVTESGIEHSSRTKLKLRKRGAKDKSLKQVSDELDQYLAGRKIRLGFKMLSFSTAETLRGWKLHISPKPIYVMETLKVLEGITKKYSCEVKCCVSLDHYMNKMTGDQTGKFITVYPDSDEQAGQISEEIHKGLRKAGMTGESYFMKIKNDFEVYPGIYARFCDYSGRVGRNSRYQSGIPPKVLKEHLEALNIKKEEYMHPFKKLSLNGIEMPKEVNQINDFLMNNLIGKSTWEMLTDLSQIPNNGNFEFAAPFDRWCDAPPEDLVAIAKVTLPRHADFKIVCIPSDIEKYYVFQFGKQKGSIYPRIGHTLISNLLNCLESGHETVRIKTVPLILKSGEKNNINVLKDPQKFLQNIQSKLAKKPVAEPER